MENKHVTCTAISSSNLTQYQLQISVIKNTNSGTVWKSGFVGCVSDIEEDYPTEDFYESVVLTFKNAEHTFSSAIELISDFSSTEDILRALSETSLDALLNYLKGR